VFCDTEPEIWMNVEPIKDRQRFTLALAAFLDLTSFFIDRVDLALDRGGRKHIS
jgi:hypothetical protein